MRSLGNHFGSYKLASVQTHHSPSCNFDRFRLPSSYNSLHCLVYPLPTSLNLISACRDQGMPTRVYQPNSPHHSSTTSTLSYRHFSSWACVHPSLRTGTSMVCSIGRDGVPYSRKILQISCRSRSHVWGDRPATNNSYKVILVTTTFTSNFRLCFRVPSTLMRC
jgi:hypothetical protein